MTSHGTFKNVFLTLLNTVYKIASGSIAKRFKTSLHSVIDVDQTGFTSGRFIEENSRLIYDIMHYAETKIIPGLLLNIDLEKAFDTVSWKFIEHVIKNFNFGKDIKKWVHLFQNNIFSVVKQGENISENVNIHLDCGKENPISSYICILCVEVLANHIRNNKKTLRECL